MGKTRRYDEDDMTLQERLDYNRARREWVKNTLEGTAYKCDKRKCK